jgi:hypothetical protein
MSRKATTTLSNSNYSNARPKHDQQSSFSMNETPLFYGSRIIATNEPIKQVFIHSETKIIKEIILSTNPIKNS